MTERLREIEQRCEKATPGPWRMQTCACGLGCDDRSAVKVAGELLVQCGEDSDVAFVAHAREDIPYLLGVIKEQADTIQELSFKLLGISFNSLVDVKQLLSEKPILQKLMESNGEHSETYEASERAEDKVWGYGFTGTVILGDDGEHSEDAKPLDG